VIGTLRKKKTTYHQFTPANLREPDDEISFYDAPLPQIDGYIATLPYLHFTSIYLSCSMFSGNSGA